MFATSIGGWAMAGYADNYIQDLKMAHYTGIPPRAVFRSQFTSILLTSIVAAAFQNWMITGIPDICTPDQPAKLTCVS